MSKQESDSDVDDWRQPELEDDISRLIFTCEVDVHRNPPKNIWTKNYLNGNTWVRNSNGSISVAVGHMFINKDH